MTITSINAGSRSDVVLDEQLVHLAYSPAAGQLHPVIVKAVLTEASGPVVSLLGAQFGTLQARYLVRAIQDMLDVVDHRSDGGR